MARLAVLGLATLVSAPFAHAAAFAAEESPITPYRPSVSSPAQLPVPGQLEVELGGLRAHSDDARRSSLPVTLKLAFDKSWGLVVSSEAHVWSRDTTAGGTGRASGIGDTSLIVKRAFIVDDATAFGLELASKRPTARDDIGSGKADYTLNSVVSRDIGSLHLDANLNVTRVGAIDLGAARTQTGASAAFSGAVSERFGLTGELSGTRRSGAPSGVQWLGAVTFSPTRRLTFDMGVARAVRPAPATMQLFAGVVFPVANLF